jgi:uncharacterized membrane protein
MSEVSAPRRRRWLIAGLVLSLVLNAFFIGVTATDLLRPHRASGPLRFELRWLEDKLPADGFAKVEAAVGAIRPAVVAHVERLKQMRQSLGVLAAAPQPDRAAIDARLAEIRAELNQMNSEGQVAAMDALLALPPDMRAKLANGSSGQ